MESLGRPERPRWTAGPLIYYLLAAFDLLTVTASLYLNHRIMGIYLDSVRANQEWARRMSDYSSLGDLAADVNAPGNDVFHSREVAREAERMAEALTAFRSRVEELRGELQDGVGQPEAAPLLAGLGEIDAAMVEMVEEARLIFSHFEAGERTLAGERMATMDRKYADLLGAHRRLSAQVAAIQQRTSERQTAAAEALQHFEYAIAGAILLMVTAATLYGRKLWRMSALAAQELERRVEERTRELREMQETALREERMRAMGSLVASVAHEVRNPLFGISSTLDAFEARHGRDEPFQRYLAVLRRETDRLAHLMRDLLEYGKPPRLDITVADLRTVAEEAAALCKDSAASSGVAVSISSGFSAGRLSLDRSRMIQVLHNMIENAIQHSPPGGRVLIQGGRDSEGTRVTAWCSVKDEGPGFRDEDLPRLFEPFFSRRRAGTGMGLSIAQRVVVQHGGSLEAANDPEGGARVTVKLPATSS